MFSDFNWSKVDIMRRVKPYGLTWTNFTVDQKWQSELAKFVFSENKSQIFFYEIQIQL